MSFKPLGGRFGLNVVQYFYVNIMQTDTNTLELFCTFTFNYVFISRETKKQSDYGSIILKYTIKEMRFPYPTLPS